MDSTPTPRTLEEHLEQLLGVDRFEPPASFLAEAQLTDSAVYDEAADAPAWWADHARQRLVWDTPFTTALDDTKPPATKPGSATRPLPGVSATVLDVFGKEVEVGTGSLVLTQPWPSMVRTLHDDPDRYVSTYFSRFGPRTYVVGDAARRDKDGYIWIIGRIDDVINVSGHRLSTAEIESALVSHPAFQKQLTPSEPAN